MSADEPVFTAPWEAQVFALVVTLHEQGMFTWKEWTETLARHIALAPPDVDGSGYEHWLAALERLVVAKGIGAASELDALYRQWDRAARATPHGQAIELERGAREDRTPIRDHDGSSP